jgi:magnesium-protoporphyrin O-methyltransferase
MRYSMEKTWLLMSRGDLGMGIPAGEQRALGHGRLIAEAARLVSGIKAIEIGCGTGLFTKIFAESGAEIMAVDVSQELIDLAGRHPIEGGNVKFKAIPFKDPNLISGGPIDAVIGSSFCITWN